MEDRQLKITQKFKNQKDNQKTADIKNEIKRGQKRKMENDEKDFKIPHQLLNKKRIKLENKNEDITSFLSKNCDKANEPSSKTSEMESKSTVSSSKDIKAKGFQLSTKTKNILDDILKKKNKKIEKVSLNDRVLNNDLELSKDLSISNSPKESLIKTDINTNIVNNKKPPVLSDKAKEIIEKLKKDRQNRFERNKDQNNNRSVSRSESSFSLRFKYEELIQDKRELPLPIKYKTLYNSFCNLENIINLNKLKINANNTTNSFDYMAKQIEESTHKRFDINVFKQILYVAPHFYIYKYEKVLKENNQIDYKLIIDIPDDFLERNIKQYDPNFNFIEIQMPKGIFNCTSCPLTLKESNDRKKIFKNLLIEIINRQHKEFLEKNKLKLFNPYIEKTWHHKFDLQSCIDIPQFEIANKPNEAQVFHQLIQEQDIKSTIINEALDNQIILYDEDSKEDDGNSVLNKYVSKEFINKLKKKENAIKISDEIMNNNYYLHSVKDYKDLTKEILTQMKTYLFVNSKTSCEFSKLIDKVYNSSDKIRNNLSIDEVKIIIKQLAINYPSLVKIKKHSSLGNIIIMNMHEFIPEDINIDFGDLMERNNN